MKERITSRLIWTEASKFALIFAAITIGCGLIKRGIAAWDPGAFVTGLFGAILWAGEFIGCIYLMILLMRKLVRDFDGVQNADTNRYGRRIALLSAVVIASVNFLILYFTPEEELQKTIEEAMSAYGSMLDSNSLSVMEDLLQEPSRHYFHQQPDLLLPVRDHPFCNPLKEHPPARSLCRHQQYARKPVDYGPIDRHPIL